MWYVFVPVAAVVILALLRGESIRIVNDIIAGSYDERRFYYWSFYYKDWHLLIIPISLLILGSRWLYLRQKQDADATHLTLRRVLITLGVASVLAVGWLVVGAASGAQSPNPEHIGTVQVLDKSYHLDRIFHTGGDDRYVLYACDLWGLRCHAIYTEVGNAGEAFDELELIGFPLRTAGVVGIALDGELVYTFTPEE
jgi:hypothetical protein